MSDAIDRREFARWMTLGISASGTASIDSIAGAADEPPKPPSLPMLVLARIKEEFPSDRYDEATVEGILQDVRADLARSRELSAFPLQNSDEPAFVFPAVPRTFLVIPPKELR
jgi:hypothetical protein